MIGTGCCYGSATDVDSTTSTTRTAADACSEFASSCSYSSITDGNCSTRFTFTAADACRVLFTRGIERSLALNRQRMSVQIQLTGCQRVVAGQDGILFQRSAVLSADSDMELTEIAGNLRCGDRVIGIDTLF